MFEIRLGELPLNHPPSTPSIKGGRNKESSLISMFPLPWWERDRVRGKLYPELAIEKLGITDYLLETT